MVNLNLTTVIAAAGGFYNIIDFQGNCVDGPGGQTEDLTGIESYTCTGGQNQKWSFNAVGANFQITLANFPTTVLSMPMVGTTIPPFGLIYQQAAMRTNSIMTWQLVPVKSSNKFNIVSTISTNNPPVALTSWAKRPGNSTGGDSPSAPLTFTSWNQNDVQQAFTLMWTS